MASLRPKYKQDQTKTKEECDQEGGESTQIRGELLKEAKLQKMGGNGKG